MVKCKKTLSCFLFVLLIVFLMPINSGYSFASTNLDRVNLSIEKVINYEKATYNIKPNKTLFNFDFLDKAGEWLPMAICRTGYEDNYTRYTNYLTNTLESMYQNPNFNKNSKPVTDYQRYAIAYSATAKTYPTNVGTDFNNEPINLLSDGVYNSKLNPNQTVATTNQWIFALIAVDCLNFPIPNDAKLSREDIIKEIMRCQVADGGFNLTIAKSSDVDTTAMAIQALAPYYNSEKQYTYTSINIKDSLNKPATITKTVSQVIHEAVNLLASRQQESGGFISAGFENAESVSQVITALCSLNINPLTDSRFIKNNKTLLDVLLSYQLDNGAFSHSFTFDPALPDVNASSPNGLATEQALYGLASLKRCLSNMRTLYDMQDEFTSEERAKIDECISDINLLTASSTETEITSAITKYSNIDKINRRYVANYHTLSKLAKEKGLQNNLPDYSGDNVKPVEPSKPSEPQTPTYTENFTEKEKTLINSLPEKIDTSYKNDLLELKYIINNSNPNIEGYNSYKLKVEAYLNKINAIEQNISKIKKDILDNLYPYDSINLGKKDMVNSIYERYNALSDYDKTLFDDNDIEAIIFAKTKIKNLTTTTIVTAVICSVIALIAIILVVVNIKKHKKIKQDKYMPESDE